MSEYRQCRLVKGVRCQVAWIPKSLAKTGSYIRIGNENGWLVDWAGNAEPPAYVLERKSHRRGDFGSLVDA